MFFFSWMILIKYGKTFINFFRITYYKKVHFFIMLWNLNYKAGCYLVPTTNYFETESKFFFMNNQKFWKNVIINVCYVTYVENFNKNQVKYIGTYLPKPFNYKQEYWIVISDRSNSRNRIFGYPESAEKWDY